MKVSPGGKLTISVLVYSRDDKVVSVVDVTTDTGAVHRYELPAGVSLALEAENARRIEVVTGLIAFTTRTSGVWTEMPMVEGDTLDLEPLKPSASVSRFEPRVSPFSKH